MAQGSDERLATGNGVAPMTMGTREKVQGAGEYDMASRKARRVLGKKAGRWTYYKTRFWRRIRKFHKQEQ